MNGLNRTKYTAVIGYTEQVNRAEWLKPVDPRVKVPVSKVDSGQVSKQMLCFHFIFYKLKIIIVINIMGSLYIR